MCLLVAVDATVHLLARASFTDYFTNAPIFKFVNGLKPTPVTKMLTNWAIATLIIK